MDFSTGTDFSRSGRSRSRRGHGSRFMVTESLMDVSVNYQVDEQELGVGLYGTVRKCRHRETGQWCAVKSIKKNKVTEVETLKREICILQKVKHPNIIRLIDVYEDERYLHLVTELCTGGELFDRIIEKFESDEGHFSEVHAARLIKSVVDAIRYCHDEMGIVHRDLKPENFLFLTPADDSPIKIIDFGLSRHDDAGGVMQTRVGTPYYVAPEVLKQKYTNSCDMWSIGVITYILLCGYPPFAGDDDIEVFESVKAGEFDFPSPEWDEISESAKEFVSSLLQLNPDARLTAAQALKHHWFAEQLGEEKSINTKSSHHAISNHSRRMVANFSEYLAKKRLKKVALNFITADLTEAEAEPLWEIFQNIRKADEEVITLDELRVAMDVGKFFGQIKDQLEDLRKALEGSETGSVKWKEYLLSTMDRNAEKREENIKRVFNKLTKGDKNHLQIEDVIECFGGEEQAQEMFDYLDLDGDGKISLEDFQFAVEASLDDLEDEEADDPSDDEFGE